MTDLLYSDVEESLRTSVRETVRRHLTSDDVSALYDKPSHDVSALWNGLAREIGIAGLLIPQAQGGAGASAREVAVVLEELGAAVAPVPFLTSSVIATTVLVELGDTTLLPQLADGTRTAALVLPWSATAGRWSSVSPNETVGLVAGALEADAFLVPMHVDGDLTLRLLSRDDVGVRALTTFDMTRQLAEVTVTDVGVDAARGREVAEAIDTALLVGAGVLASEQLGLARRCLEMTVEYAKTRVQFARPIGSFQAIKHRLADLYLDIVLAHAAARYAADTLATSEPDREIAVATAQSWCSEVAVRAAEEAIQLHGGIGMTWEHPIHLYLKRAKSNQVALGRPMQHRRDLASLVGLSSS